MACGQSFYEDNPAKEQLREERRLRQNEENATKILKFFQDRLDPTRVSCVPKAHMHSHDCKKILVTKGEEMLTIHHRGYEIQVRCDPARWTLEFSKWQKSGMTHARIIRQDH